MEENRHESHRLQELGGSKYEIKSGQPDIRSWEVKTEAGERIGEVDELIFDVQEQKVRYIVLDLEDNTLDLDERDVLIPIGMAEIHQDDDVIILPEISAAQLQSLPNYDKDQLSELDENSIRSVFLAQDATSETPGHTDTTPDLYGHQYFDEDRLNRRRSTDTPQASDHMSRQSGFNSEDEPGKGYIDPDREIF